MAEREATRKKGDRKGERKRVIVIHSDLHAAYTPTFIIIMYM